MSEAPTPAPDTSKVSSAETNGQLIVSLAIVTVLGVIGVGLIVIGLKTEGAAILGSIVGALANALTAPSGIGNVLRAGAPKP